MMGDFGFGHMWFGWIFWLVLIALAVVLFRRFVPGAGTGNAGYNRGSDETPLEILKKRYARGEISKEEFERMKKDII